MMHPDTELRFVSEEIGLGVFAKKFIPKGTIVWALDDLDILLKRDEVESLDPIRKQIVDKYSYQSGDDEFVLCWDIGRYMNHSFSPNCIATAYEIELATRDIYPGEELTVDYATMRDEEPFDCLSEEGSSRTRVMPDDHLYLYPEWDQLIREAFQFFNLVDQPLKHLIKPEFIDKIHAIAEGREDIDSILTIFGKQIPE